jgi:hypothetical protein
MHVSSTRQEPLVWPGLSGVVATILIFYVNNSQEKLTLPDEGEQLCSAWHDRIGMTAFTGGRRPAATARPPTRSFCL